jgi:uncharacterized repeat protein (TIGR03803 family)
MPAYCDLLHVNGKIYGMTPYGGPFDAGVIFQFDTAGNKYKVLHCFDKINGAYPYGSLMQAKNGKFYGMTTNGGKYDDGVLFSYSLDSAVFKVLHHFKDSSTGANPSGDLIQATNGLLYGMTSSGGIYNKGVIFSYHIGSSKFTTRYNFNDTNGAEPRGTLTQVGGRLYGVTRTGGNNTGKGAIFSIDTTKYKITLHNSFGGQNGESPMGKLIMANNGRLYGVCVAGGVTPGLYPGTSGLVFSIDTATHTFSVIRHFSGIASLANPIGSLVKLGNGRLFGTCSYHINSPYKGGVFSIRPTSSYRVEKSFTNDEPASVMAPMSILTTGKLIGLSQYGGQYINRGLIYTYDTATKAVKNLLEFSTGIGGSNPNGFLTMAANGLLYGTTLEGGTDKKGVLFSVNPLTGEKKVVHDFLYNSGKGLSPRTKLVQAADGKLWGVTAFGGSGNSGTIFSFDTAKKVMGWEYEFQGGNNGQVPYGNVVFDSSGNIYGTTFQGGANNTGIFYKFNPSTRAFVKLFDFIDTLTGSHPNGILNLTKSGKIIGLTTYGGKYQSGALFVFNPKDSTLKIEVSLKDTLTGTFPNSGLMEAYNGLYYGMGQYGGKFDDGSIFSYNDSTGKARLEYSFVDTFSGRQPQGSLSQFHNGLIYGMGTSGGKNGVGTIFTFSPDSGKVVKIFDFDRYHGASPSYGALVEIFTEPNRWTGTKDSLWTRAENWSNRKLPSEVQESIIPANAKRFPIINAKVVATNLVIDSGAVVTIAQGYALTVNSKLTNNGTLNVLQKASLLPGKGYEQTGKGTYNIHRKISSNDTSDFALWSAPVKTIKASILPGKINNKYKFKPGGNSSSDFINLNSGDTLKVGVGYRANNDTSTIIINGNVNNGNLYAIVKFDTAQRIFNLLGNPYPGAINASKFLDKNRQALDRVIYVKLPKNKSSKYSADELVTINDFGASGNGITDTTLTLTTAEIGAATGFFTVSLKSDTARFDNTMRTNNTPVINAVPTIFQKLRITLTAPDSFYSQTDCVFSQGATDNYDAGQDAYRFSTSKGVGVYSMLKTSSMSVQSFPIVETSKSIQLGLQSSVKGKYKWTLQEIKALDYYKISLIDRDSNKVYSFQNQTITVLLDSSKVLNQRFSLKVERILPQIQVVKNKVCKGDTTVFKVAVPNSNFKYQWIFNGNAAKGDTLTTFRAVKSGKLILRQTYRDQNSDETAELQVIVNDLPQKPVLKRNIVVLNAGTGYKSYKWFYNTNAVKDSSRQFLNIVKSGAYFCMVSDTNKCLNFSDTLVLKKVEINIVKNDVCMGEKAEAKVKSLETGFKYAWVLNGKPSSIDTSETINLTQATDLSLIMYHANGFKDTATTVKITFKALPSKPVLTQSIGTLDAGSGYVNYKWYRNNIILNGSTSQTLQYPRNGGYYCVVENSNSCLNYSDTITIKKVAITAKVNNPCSGDTAKFEITEPKKGFRYQWVFNSNSAKADTGLSYNSTIAGTLKLIEFNGLGFKDTSSILNITIRPLPTSPKLVLADARLNAGAGYTRYLWLKDANKLKTDTTQFLNLSDTGLYVCSVANAVGCWVNSPSFDVKKATVLVKRNNVCEGDTTVFNVTNVKSGFKYQWIIDGKAQATDTNLSLRLLKSASVRLFEYNKYGYKDTAALINAVVNPLPVMPVIGLLNATLDAGSGYAKYIWFKNGSLISGLNQQYCDITTPATYICKVYNGFRCENTSKPFEVKAAILKGIKTTICDGDSALFQILDRKSGFNYQWFADGKPVKASNDSQLRVTKSVMVKFLESNTAGYTIYSDSVLVVVNPLPKPQVPVFKNGLLEVDGGFDSYQWFKNSNPISGKTNSILAPDGNGAYYVNVTLKGCAAPSPTINFNKVSIIATSLKFCKYDSAQLKVQDFDTAFKYQWILNEAEIFGQNSETLFAKEAGNVKVVKWHPAGFRDTSFTKQTEELPLPTKPVLTRNQLVLNAGSTFTNYQWYLNNVEISGAQNATFTMGSTGKYFCKVGNASGCFNYSDTLDVQSLRITNLDIPDYIKLYPNPSTGEAYISILKEGIARVSISDMHGKIISSMQETSYQNMPLEVKNFPAGMYIVNIELSGVVYHLKLVKQ